LDSQASLTDTRDVTSETPLPAIRASDDDRERAVAWLRERAVDGRLSHDSFVWRVDRVMRARSRAELTDVVRDLPPEGRVTRALTSAATSLSTMVTRVRAAWQAPQATRLAPLALPREAGRRVIIGREHDCDLLVSEISVSRHHAELFFDGSDWSLRDLGSKNGTRVNGMRIQSPTRVRPGDAVSFGGTRFRLVLQLD
jgi:hypothetical protein